MPEIKFITENKVDAGEIYFVDFSEKMKSFLLHHVTGAITILPVNPKRTSVDKRILESL